MKKPQTPHLKILNFSTNPNSIGKIFNSFEVTRPIKPSPIPSRKISTPCEKFSIPPEEISTPYPLPPTKIFSTLIVNVFTLPENFTCNHPENLSKPLNNSQPPGIFLNPSEIPHTLKISQPSQYFLTPPPPEKISTPPGYNLNPSEKISTPPEKISTPPEKISTPPEKSQPLPKKISTPPEKISTPPRKSQPLPKKCQPGFPNNSQPQPKKPQLGSPKNCQPLPKNVTSSEKIEPSPK